MTLRSQGSGFYNFTDLLFNALIKPLLDVSNGLRKFRDFLLGRKHTLHGRFPSELAPRSIPPADIPRGMQLKYSDQYYFERSAINSVKPPVVAPVAEGPPLTKAGKKSTSTCDTKPQSICFDRVPTPGPVWWWDGHCFYDCSSEEVNPKKPECPSEPTPGGEQSLAA